MAKLTIKSGNNLLDGEYELDFTGSMDFTKAEWYLMKQKVGVVVADLQPGKPLDMSILTALGLVALKRAGKEHMIDVFMETKDSQTSWTWDDAEIMEVDDEVPPKIGSGSLESGNTNSESSGASTSSDSEHYQEAVQ